MRATTLLALLLAWFFATGAPVAQPDACPTWLPDLRCDREGRYPGFVTPMTAPFQFEEPFITTSLSAWALWHEFPSSSLFEGGELRGLALQIRVALTDRLGLIASKDGRIEVRPDNDLLDTEVGYGDLGVGLKYALIDRPDDRFILTPSLRYELTQGSRDALQGNGEGVWVPAVSSGLGLGDFHVLSAFGARLPVDGDEEATMLFYNVQVDRPVSERVVPFVSVNGIHYLDDGDGSTTLKTSIGTLPLSTIQSALGTGAFDALDVSNLGSDGVDGHDFVSGAIGLRVHVRRGLQLGAAYERPITRRRGIMKQRVSLNAIWDF